MEEKVNFGRLIIQKMELRKLLPAHTLRELFRILIPIHPLDKRNAHLRVPLYEKKLAEIRLDLLASYDESYTVYVTGQAGSGKTTALNFLSDPELDEGFVLLYLNAQDLVENLDDVDIIDIMLMLAFKLAAECPPIMNDFEKELEKIREVIKGRREEVEERIKVTAHEFGGDIKISLAGNPLVRWLNTFKAEGNFYVDYRRNQSTRILTRTIFKPDVPELVSLVNKMIAYFLDEIAINTNKKLLVVFHELNHMRNLNTIEKLFIDNAVHLENIRAKKVVTIPITLVSRPLFKGRRKVLNIKIKPNPLTENTNQEEKNIEKSRKVLRKIFQKRLRKEFNPFSEEALDLLIEQSGGNIRQFISLLQNTVRHVLINNSKTVTLTDAEAGVGEERKQVSYSVTGKGRLKLLEYIGTEHLAEYEDETIFNESILANHIFAYENDDIWYDLNPVIKPTVNLYSSKKEEEDE